MSAHKLLKAYPFIIDLIKSRPPKKITSPNITTICINNFFLVGNFIAKNEKIIIGKANIEGIKDVKDVLSLIKLMTKPQIKRKKP
tara:strand:+ start:222 stop:476 length:255 start_codon:yes stop_codon:yes gene_type:complete